MASNINALTQAEKEALFAQWLQGEFESDSTKASKNQSLFEQLCINDSDFAQRVEQANNLNMLKDITHDAQVPKWHHKVDFPFIEQTRWWQWQGMPAASFCCSLVAIVMVLSGFNLNIQNGRLSLGFGNQDSNAHISALVEQKVQDKLVAQQQANQDLLAQYVEIMHQQQLQTSSQLTEYLLTSSRTERREDFAELIKFVNQQRFDDQVFYARQLNELQTEINLQTGADFDVLRSIQDIRVEE